MKDNWVEGLWNRETKDNLLQRWLSRIFCMASSYKTSSHFPILPHYCTAYHKLLIYRLEISMIERNSCSHASCNFAIFLTLVVLGCEFLKIAIFGAK